MSSSEILHKMPIPNKQEYRADTQGNQIKLFLQAMFVYIISLQARSQGGPGPPELK